MPGRFTHILDYLPPIQLLSRFGRECCSAAIRDRASELFTEGLLSPSKIELRAQPPPLSAARAADVLESERNDRHRHI